jgi:hypothetical protein
LNIEATLLNDSVKKESIEFHDSIAEYSKYLENISPITAKSDFHTPNSSIRASTSDVNELKPGKYGLSSGISELNLVVNNLNPVKSVSGSGLHALNSGRSGWNTSNAYIYVYLKPKGIDSISVQLNPSINSNKRSFPNDLDGTTILYEPTPKKKRFNNNVDDEITFICRKKKEYTYNKDKAIERHFKSKCYEVELNEKCDSFIFNNCMFRIVNTSLIH